MNCKFFLYVLLNFKFRMENGMDIDMNTKNR